MKPICLTHIPIPNRFGSLYCSNCGVWLDDGTAVAPTERAPALETFALPKPEPLRSDYEKNYGQGPSAFDAHMKLEAQGACRPVATQTIRDTALPLVPKGLPRPVDWIEIGRSLDLRGPSFAERLNVAVSQQWRKQESDLCAYLFEQLLRVARDYCVHALACNVDGYNLTLFTDCGGLAHTALVSVLEPFLPNAAFRVGDYWELP